MKVLRLNLAVALLGAVIVAAMSGPAAGGPNTVLKVQFGWGDKVRAGHWTPIFIQATDPTPQSAEVEINAPQGSLYAMQVRQYFTISPVPSTLTLFVPLQSGWGDGPAIVIRDENQKTMARFPSDPENESFYQHIVNGNMRLVGVSGQHTSLQNMQGQVAGNALEVGYLDPELLPIAPLGYDCLDLLVLNEPDLLHLRVEQQQAIVDWVRGGGHLILWPGDDPAPKDGPLIDALPCTIAGRTTVNLTDRDLTRLALPHRFAGIRGRTLEPRSGTDAAAVDLFRATVPTSNPAYRRSLGLGSILVAPVNVSQLQFEGPADEFWATLLSGTAAVPAADAQNIGYGNVDAYTRRMYSANQSLEDFLGNVPGAGKFGFSYVALVLLGMMVVVGPVDWFVLRKLGRQPWTWVTTTGWIVLVTVGALFIGHIFKSGKLHYGSVRVIDQAGGVTVGETSLTGIYSPRTTSYHLDAAPGPTAPNDAGVAPTAASQVPPPGWWSVASTEEYGSRHGMANDISFHQTDEGNTPEEMFINVWNLRFLREESTRAGPPMIDATLAYSPMGADRRLTGVIRNLGSRPLTNIHVRVKAGIAFAAARIEANSSAAVNTDLDTSANGPFAEVQTQQFNHYGQISGPIPAGDLWHVAGDLSAIRTQRIESLLRTEEFACIYAESPGSEPPAVLREAAGGLADQQHYELIRAMVPLTSRDVFRPRAK